MLNLKSSPDICRVVNLIVLLFSKDKCCHRHVINVLSNPVHLGHHPVHFANIFTCSSGKCYLYRVYQSETCNNDNCAGAGNIHSLSSRNKVDFILWVCISQFHHNLTVEYHQICKYICTRVIRLNLRPGKRSLVAKVEDEAVVHDVLTLDPRHRYTYKLQFFFVLQNSHRIIFFTLRHMHSFQKQKF